MLLQCFNAKHCTSYGLAYTLEVLDDYCTISGAGTMGHGGGTCPPPTFPDGWARGGTVEERLITIIYC